ncbi:MAG: TetR/AcrR family transcriptional regulator [Acidobacteria bacterium]|nr:TetR/AcrR family transcriptional regulator [Acidobacteriota bacterium]MBV9476378.1 TetR/AcrR family transcriptional regulator [Acidobacteriota bacterium]
MTTISIGEPTVRMTQEERSEKSRQQILDAALKLFSHKGYGATSVRDIAEEAGLSKGNVYHHFPDKETIFRGLLDRYFQAMSQPDFPFNRALAEGSFPENLEGIGNAVREIVRDYREYVALIYVDVVEFDGTHVRKFYGDMAERFNSFMKAHGMEKELEGKLAAGLSPVSAVMLATRIFYNYFTVEILFGVKDHFGKDTDAAVREISRILRHGMLKPNA